MHRHLRSPVSVMLCFHSYKANNTPAYKFNNSATSGTHSPIVRPNTKFQQNTTVHGWFTDWTKFSCPSFIFLRGRGRGAWATSSQSWVGRTRPNLVSSLARQVCLRYPVCCSVSKPERLKCQISHFVWPHVKIRGGMGEIFESVFSRIVYAPMHDFRYTLLNSFQNHNASKATGKISDFDSCKIRGKMDECLSHFLCQILVIWRRNRFQGTGSKVPEPVPKPGTCGTVFWILCR